MFSEEEHDIGIYDQCTGNTWVSIISFLDDLRSVLVRSKTESCYSGSWGVPSLGWDGVGVGEALRCDSWPSALTENWNCE